MTSFFWWFLLFLSPQRRVGLPYPRARRAYKEGLDGPLACPRGRGGVHGRLTSTPPVTAASPAIQAWRGVKPSPGVLWFTPGHAQGLPVVSFEVRELSRHARDTCSTSPRAAASQRVGVTERISFVLAKIGNDNSSARTVKHGVRCSRPELWRGDDSGM